MMSDTNYILTSDGTFMSDNELRHYGIKGGKTTKKGGKKGGCKK